MNLDLLQQVNTYIMGTILHISREEKEYYLGKQVITEHVINQQ